MIPAIGRSAKSTITTSGPAIAFQNAGRLLSLSLPSRSFAVIVSPFFLVRYVERMIVTIRAQMAGTIFFIIRDVRLTLKPSERAIVFGFGEMMFPALPPPIIASRTPLLESPARSPIARAIGATVITEMSTKTPTAQITIVAIEIAATARRSPSLSTIVSAIFCAEPVSIRAPARIPLVKILSTEDIMLPAPLIIVFTVLMSPPPPISPPISAPKISE